VRRLKTRVRSGSTLFGELLREHRLRRGFSQEYLAEKAGISLEAVSSLERGTRRAPYRNTLALLVAALELNPVESVAFDEAASQARARVRTGTTGARAANNLPAQFSSFVGREGDVAEVRDLIAEHRLVSVVGAAGIGKTRLALRVATQLLESAFDGVWFVDLASLRDPKLIPGAILSALNVSESSERPPLDTLVAYLKTKQRVLVILDNCEHLIHGAALAAEAILQSCHRVTILATTREVLGIAGENVVRLPTLSMPDAISLFVERAKETDSHFVADASLQSSIAQICLRLDGIALAIELAAARMNILSPLALAETLNERFLALTGGKRTAPPRHRTLRAMLDWSYELLDDREQRVLRKLSVFVGGFTPERATALFANDDPIAEHEMLEVLSSLVDKSLIQYESRCEATRYRLLESTRQYAKEKLRERGELDDTARAHALAMLALVERFTPLNFVSDYAWKTQAQPEIENWRAAMVWAFGRGGDRLIGQRLAGAITDIWFAHATEGSRWVRYALETCDGDTPLLVRAKLELAQVIMSYPLGRAQTDATFAAAQRALQLYQRAGDPLGVAAAQIFIGERFAFKADLPEAERLLGAALAVAKAGNARRLVAMATRYLGLARGFAGDIDAARQLIGSAVAMYKADGATSGGDAIQGINLAEFEFRVGNADVAFRLASESVATFREYNLAFGLCGVLSNLSAYAIALERFDDARDYAREAIDLAMHGSFDVHFAWCVQHLGSAAALQRRDYRRAAKAFGFVNARLLEFERERGFTEEQEYDRVLALLRNELGGELDALMNEGALWSKDQALPQLSER
jgi:predicted ATPase/DNA-binding XRE family transcriptional regulator